jgi:hypothetical protein
MEKNSARDYHKCTYFFMQSARYSCRILIYLIFFSDRFSKNVQISNTMEIRLVAVEVFHADKQSDW